MKKNSKLITAAALTASKTVALNLEDPKDANPPAAYSNPDPCQGTTNVYACMEERVNTALGELKDDVATHKAECLVTADELRDQILTEIQSIRSNIETSLTEAV